MMLAKSPVLRIAGLALFVVLLWGCGAGEQTRSGHSLIIADAKPVKVGKEWRDAVPINHTLPVTGLVPGSRARLFLGNTSDKPANIILDGLTPNKVVLEPGVWTMVEGTMIAPQVFLRVGKQEGLFFAQPFLSPHRKDQRPNVLLLSLDTLRADYFTPEHMPLLYAAFSKGARWQQAYTTSPWTLPAHASLLTGSYPAQHGVRLPEDVLSEDAVSVAEVFRDAGFQTLAVTEGNYVSAESGFFQGFLQYREDGPRMMEQDPAAVSRLETNLAWLKAQLALHSNASRFVFFHTYEVHCPYLPRGDLADPEGFGQTQWLLDHDTQAIDQATLDHLKALYAGEVAYLDRVLGPFVAELLAQGWVVALTSDHGEEFGEHGGLLHADNLYQEAVAVPMALAGPEIAPQSFDQAVSLVDLPATLVSQLGLEVPASWQGRGLLTEGYQPPPAVFFESFFLGPQIAAKDPRLAGVLVPAEGLKLVQLRNQDQHQAWLFDLKADPAEQTNLQETRAADRDRLFGMLELYLNGKGLDPKKREALDEEQLAIMRTLGYVD